MTNFQSIRFSRIVLAAIGGCMFCCALCECCDAGDRTVREFKAGAAAIDVSPPKLPVIVNGGMEEQLAYEVFDPLHARALVLDDGASQIAIVIVDSCMIPRTLLDDAKQLASAATGIPTARMLVAATHAHSVPSVHGCLGSDVDVEYARFLPGKIAEAIIAAHKNRVPARIGFAMGRNEKYVASRRWLMRPGTAPTVPFTGKEHDLAQMHPGFDNPNALRATGPVDPELPVLAVQTRDGKPLATLTNYSLHYVGAGVKPVSADYFPVVCRKLQGLLQAGNGYVGLHSNGTSGDAYLRDYSQSKRREVTVDGVAESVAQAAFAAYGRIKFHDWVSLAMEERLLEIRVRVPPPQELAEARKVVAALGGQKPRKREDIYAREAVFLSEMPPTRELKLQAIRVGDVGIAAIPNEVFGITGLTIKQRSPLKSTFTIELANGCEGYIPPPEQHALGGYETWRARTSCLEENAEVKIAAMAIDLLRSVAGSPAP